VLDDLPDDMVEAEWVAALEALNDHACRDRVALIRIGRGEFDLADCDLARDAALDIGRAPMAR
jgi:hypothetical protein